MANPHRRAESGDRFSWVVKQIDQRHAVPVAAIVYYTYLAEGNETINSIRSILIEYH
jgi:hypothetical protein